jgi:hypothetical protein
MTSKHWALIFAAVVLGGFSLYLNRDWFHRDSIQIYHRSRPARAALFGRKRADVAADINPIIFGFDRKLRLTALKVIPIGALQTNKYAQPVWHLVSNSNSVPIKDFTYGMAIKGMHSANEGAVPDPLSPGVPYRLFVEAGEIKLTHDFVPSARTP